MKGKIEEIKLIAQCIATDNREAFSRLVTMHQEPLRRFILNLTGGDYCLTDDIAQDTFIKAWTGIRSFKGLSGFRTWLFRIAINEFVSYRRKAQITVDCGIDMPEEPTSAGRTHPHDATEARLDVASAIGILSDSERMVTLLFYMEDMPLKQICKATGLPEGTVKSHLSRARRKMQEFLKH